MYTYMLEEQKLPAKISKISSEELFSYLYLSDRFCYKNH